MRILVYPHDLAMGGSQLNAIDLATMMRDAGHELTVYGQRNTLVKHLEQAGLEFIESPRPRRRPTPAIVSHLRKVIRTRGVDVVHGYEWPPTLEAVLATRWTPAVAVSTVLSMSVAPFIPRSVPLMVGTEQILETEKAAGRDRVSLMEPPIDTRSNSPEAPLPVEAFRRKWDIDPTVFTVVVVSRLAREMKLEGILSAMEAIRELNSEQRVRLVVVGSGNASGVVESTARSINEELAFQAIVVTGELLDPRPAYAVADLALGMGSSALRAMAFGKPVVVQGINGFWESLTPESLPTFLWQGWYGDGGGTPDAASRLAGQIREVIAQPDRKDVMAELSLRTVRERFSLGSAAGRQLEVYEQALTARRSGLRPGHDLRDGIEALSRFLGYSARGWSDRLLRRTTDEDFNSRAVLTSSGDRAASAKALR